MGKTGPMKVAGRLVINFSMFVEDMDAVSDSSAKGQRSMVRNVDVTPTAAVRGMKMPSYHSNLSNQDIKGAFVTAQSVAITQGDNSGDNDAKETLDFDEWLVCLGLCGYIKVRVRARAERRAALQSSPDAAVGPCSAPHSRRRRRRRRARPRLARRVPSSTAHRHYFQRIWPPPRADERMA